MQKHADAGEFILRNRKQVVDSVNQWTREPKYRINELLEELVGRAVQLKLSSAKDEVVLLASFVSYTTSLVMNHRFTGYYKHSR